MALAYHPRPMDRAALTLDPGGDKTCPSAPMEIGATVLGVVGPEGRLRRLPPGMTVTPAFLEIASAGRSPAKRFRFASACQASRCKHWTGERCGVPEIVTSLLSDRVEPQPLRACAIRGTCRWFAQDGASACGLCDWVVTDMAATLLTANKEYPDGYE